MNCREVNAVLDAYLNDELAPPERERFDAHLALCESCVAYLATYRSAIAMGIRAFDSDPELDLPESLITAILSVRR